MLDVWGEKSRRRQGNPTVPPAYGQQFLPYATCGYTPTSSRAPTAPRQPSPSGIDGRGQTVAIVDAFASPTIPRTPTSTRRSTASRPVDFSQITPEDRSNGPIGGPDQCDAQGWYGEETLDVEAVHAMAPGAHVLFVGGADCLDESLIDAVNKIVDGNLAQIVSNSYGNLGETGEDAGLRQAWNDTFRQAALEGIGMYFSSGDSGDEVDDLGHPEAGLPGLAPAGDRRRRDVAGREQQRRVPVRDRLGHDEQPLTNGAWDPARPGPHLRLRRRDEPVLRPARLPEERRAQEAGQANGGSPRACARRQPRGRPEDGHARRPDADVPRRDAKYSEYRIGGTSLSSPLLAGVMALADQQAGARTASPTRRSTPSTAPRPTATPSRPTSRSRSCATTT